MLSTVISIRAVHQNNPMRKLYKNISLLLPIGVLIFASSAQISAQTAKDVARIRGEVATINKNSAKYKKVTKDVDGISLEGASATYYRSGGIVKKVAVKMFGETYNATGEFYYTDSKLVFAFVKENRYDTQIGLGKRVKVVSSEERRFYFVDGEIVRLLVKTKELKPGDERYAELKDGISAIVEKLEP